MLDSNRQIRQKKKRLVKLEAQKAKAKKIGRLKGEINSLEHEVMPDASLSGSLAKFIRTALSQIPAAKLDFFALQVGWDVLHLALTWVA